MAHTTSGYITAPVRQLEDVGAVLNIPGNSLATCCRSTAIKMWAKYKPVPWAHKNTLSALSGNVWNPAATNPWWKGTGNNYGIDYSDAVVSVAIDQYGVEYALTSLLTKVDGGANGWYYSPPTGGASQPYRLLDFLQYDHNVKNPIYQVNTHDVSASGSSIYTVEIGYIRTDPDIPITQRRYLIPEDITGETMYPGFAIFKKSGDNYIPIAWVTGSNWWQGKGINTASGPDGVIGRSPTYIESKLMDGATYYILPIYTNVELLQPNDTPNRSANVTASGAKMYTVPYTYLISFTATRRSTSQTIGVPTLSNHDISFSHRYRSKFQLDSRPTGYTGGTTSSHVIVKLVNEDWNGQDTQSNLAWTNDFGYVTVPANTLYDVGWIQNSDGTGIVLSTDHTWRVVAFVNGEMTTFNLRAPADYETT